MLRARALETREGKQELSAPVCAEDDGVEPGSCDTADRGYVKTSEVKVHSYRLSESLHA